MLRRHPLVVITSITVALVAATVWLLHVRNLGGWLQLHLGIVNEPGPYYGFWSGFGSDIAELSILGATATAVYQLVRKFNCHEPGCWRVGNHPAADGQFMLCYRHHPDYRGTQPTRELIERLHREHQERQALIHERIRSIHEHAVHLGDNLDAPKPDPLPQPDGVRQSDRVE